MLLKHVYIQLSDIKITMIKVNIHIKCALAQTKMLSTVGLVKQAGCIMIEDGFALIQQAGDHLIQTLRLCVLFPSSIYQG